MQRPRAQHERGPRDQRGYNLIEMIVATAILGVVVVSIMSLFVMGRRNVYSGKEMTAAVSMATRVSEDLSGMSVTDVYGAFGIDAASTTAVSGTVTVDSAAPKNGLPENSYTNSFIRRTTDTLVTTSGGNDAGGFLTRWKNEMDQNLRFAFGAVNVVITPRNPNLDAAGTPMALNPSSATVVRIRVLVRWQEEKRARQLIIDTVKTRRPLPPA